MSSDNVTDPEPVLVSAKVILHAGNARTLAYGALQAADEGDLTRAAHNLEKAEEEISGAHQTQTQLIQAEARGEGVALTLLLTHAQDTLMVAISEVQMARRMLGLYRRLQRLEARLGHAGQ